MGRTCGISDDGVSASPSVRFTSFTQDQLRGINDFETLKSDGPAYPWYMYCILLCVPHIRNGIFLEHGGIAILLPSARRRYGYMFSLILILLPFMNSESSVIQQPVHCRWRGAWLLLQFEKCSSVGSIGCRILLKVVGLFIRWWL